MEISSAQTQFQSSITKEEINALPLFRYEGAVELVGSQGAMLAAVAELRGETLLGFDTETRPSFKRGQNYPTALLQLAGEHKVFLFQLLQLPTLAPLAALMADPAILKVGVAIRDDIKKLRESEDFEPAGFVELADITQKAGVVNTGLRSLAGIFMGVRISKGAQVSNWSRADLSEAQVAYAATDAWISREVYLRLRERGLC